MAPLRTPEAGTSPSGARARPASRVDPFIGLVRRISFAAGLFAAGLIALAVAVVCQMVFLRYALNQTTIWQTDFVTYSLIAATFVGSPYVLMTRGHVNVDVLPQYLGPRKRYALAVWATLVSLAFSAVMLVLTANFWWEAWSNQWVSDTIWRARLWIPYASMPIGLALLTLQCIAELVALVTGREPPFGMRGDARGEPAP